MSVSWKWRGSITCVPRPLRRRRLRRRRRRRDAAAGRGSGFAVSETTPIVIDGVMYISSPYGKVVALDSSTGKELWVYQVPSGVPSTRGVEYWAGDNKTPAQIVFGTHDGRLISLHARTGEPNEAFGDKGIVNLNTPEILRGLPGSNGLGSPPIMYKHLIITGGRTQENPPLGPAGDVRAWDVRTGKLVWTFHSIPQPGEKHFGTWAGDSWKNRSGVNVWGFITVDVQRGIVYMPFGAPSVDQFGGDREGDNLFGSSLVAADANTGKYLWHFQVVHHDIWDADIANPPLLLDVKQRGRTIPAVAAISKSGLLFLLDRTNGKPIYGVEERPVPPSEVPLERAAKTQPFPIKPAPLSRMTMTPADIATITPELEAECKKLLEGVQIGGPYLPPGYNRLRLSFPGNHGGVNWGGMSFNPQLGYLFVNTNEMGQLSGLKDRDLKSGGRAQASGVGNRVHPGWSVRERAGRRPLQVPEPLLPAAALGPAHRGRREHGRVRVALDARRHRQPAAGQAEHRPAGQRRLDRHGRRPRLHRRDRRCAVPRVRCEDGQGSVDPQAGRRRERHTRARISARMAGSTSWSRRRAADSSRRRWPTTASWRLRFLNADDSGRGLAGSRVRGFAGSRGARGLVLPRRSSARRGLNSRSRLRRTTTKPSAA